MIRFIVSGDVEATQKDKNVLIRLYGHGTDETGGPAWLSWAGTSLYWSGSVNLPSLDKNSFEVTKPDGGVASLKVTCRGVFNRRNATLTLWLSPGKVAFELKYSTGEVIVSQMTPQLIQTSSTDPNESGEYVVLMGV